MSEPFIRVRWTIKCYYCFHEHTETSRYTESARYFPPPVPSECANCDHELKVDQTNWYRWFEIEEIHS